MFNGSHRPDIYVLLTQSSKWLFLTSGGALLQEVTQAPRLRRLVCINQHKRKEHGRWCGRILWTELGGGELLPLTFHWSGLSHMVTPPAGEAGKGGPVLCLRGRQRGFMISWQSLPHCPSPLPNQDSLRKKE